MKNLSLWWICLVAVGAGGAVLYKVAIKRVSSASTPAGTCIDGMVSIGVPPGFECVYDPNEKDVRVRESSHHFRFVELYAPRAFSPSVRTESMSEFVEEKLRRINKRISKLSGRPSSSYVWTRFGKNSLFADGPRTQDGWTSTSGILVFGDHYCLLRLASFDQDRADGKDASVGWIIASIEATGDH